MKTSWVVAAALSVAIVAYGEETACDDVLTQRLLTKAREYWTQQRGSKYTKYDIISVDRIYERPPRHGGRRRLFHVLTTLRTIRTPKSGKTTRKVKYVRASFEWDRARRKVRRSGERISLTGWGTNAEYHEAIAALDKSNTARILYPARLRQPKSGADTSDTKLIGKSLRLSPMFLVSKRQFDRAVIRRDRPGELVLDLSKVKPVKGVFAGEKDCGEVRLRWRGKAFDVLHTTRTNPQFVLCGFRVAMVELRDPKTGAVIWKDGFWVDRTSKSPVREIVVAGKALRFRIEVNLIQVYPKGRPVTLLGQALRPTKPVVAAVSLQFASSVDSQANPKPPVSLGSVTAVTGDRVTFNCGLDKGIKAGATLAIYRGSKVVAYVRVTRAGRKDGAGNITSKAIPPRIGDKVMGQ